MKDIFQIEKILDVFLINSFYKINYFIKKTIKKTEKTEKEPPYFSLKRLG